MKDLRVASMHRYPDNGCGKLTVRLVFINRANSKSASLSANYGLRELDTADRSRDAGGFCREDYGEGNREG